MYNHRIKHDTNDDSISSMMKFNDTNCPAPLSSGSPTTPSGVGSNVTAGVSDVDLITVVELLILLVVEVVDVGATMLVEVAIINEEECHTGQHIIGYIFTVLNMIL